MWYILFLVALLWKFIDTILEIVTRMTPTPFNVMLLITSVLSFCIILKSAFVRTPQEEQNKEWNFCGMLVVITVIVGIMQLILDLSNN